MFNSFKKDGTFKKIAYLGYAGRYRWCLWDVEYDNNGVLNFKDEIFPPDDSEFVDYLTAYKHFSNKYKDYFILNSPIK